MSKHSKGVVRWFSSRLGYGFIACPGLDDIIVHRECLGRFQILAEGVEVEVEYADMPKGPRAISVRIVDRSAANYDNQTYNLKDASGESDWLDGFLRDFRAEKGYGFVKSPDVQGDVFLHVTTLNNCGLKSWPQLWQDVQFKYKMRNNGTNGKIVSQIRLG